MMAGCRRREIPRWAALPASAFNDAERRASLSRSAAELLDLAERVVAELIAEAANPALTLEERRGLVAIALEVDRQAAARVGTAPNTLAVAARGRAALAEGGAS